MSVVLESHYITLNHDTETTSITVCLRSDFSLYEHPPSVKGEKSSPMAHCQSPQTPPGRTGLYPAFGAEGGTRKA